MRQTIVSLYFPSKETKELVPEARLVDIKEIINVDDYENSDEIFSAIEKYYLKNNGKCS